jgi:hypothetical protein
MRRFALFVILLTAVLAPVAITQEANDRRSEKRQLVHELLKVIDMKQFTQSLLDITFDRLSERSGDPSTELTAEQRKELEATRAKQKAQMNAFRERLYTRIDYDKISDELYVPYFEKTFSADELRTLIAFYKTKEGQKMARAMPELTIGSMMKTMGLLSELGQSISEEMQKEEEANRPPYSRTMADLRSMATAAEAYATDENHYPKASSMRDLGGILSPTYIRRMPEKDGWGNEYEYFVSSDLARYRFVSGGSDSNIDGGSRLIEPLPAEAQMRVMDKPGADIIYQDGQFVQIPAAAQKEQGASKD